MVVDRKNVFGIFTFTSGKIAMNSMPSRNIHRGVAAASSCRPAGAGDSVVALQEHVGQSNDGQGEPLETRDSRLATCFSSVVFVSEGSKNEVLEIKSKNKTAENFTFFQI